jgi:TPP-dependent pyruvate/acetoin dehydrogenase alpha subunit
LSVEELINLYRKMILIRIFEERVGELYAAKKIPGFLHLYVGEEAVAVGTCANLRKEDWITSTHRGHGHCLAKGGDPKYMMAELFGKNTGYCKGKGGSMHISDFDMGILCATGIVGSGLPLATGCGLSAKLRGTDQVSVCFFGDGASNQGTFHESLNLAAIYRLPVIYVLENNLWGQGGPIWEVCSVQNLSIRAQAYNIPSIHVDGNDVMAVYEAVQGAVGRAKNGDGPTLVVCDTYRLRNHAEGLPIRKRYGMMRGESWGSNDEVEEWKAKGPIKRFRANLLEMELLTDQDEQTIYKEIEQIIDDAVAFAEESPFPTPDETLVNVYAEEDI